jgi:hypothetical protein
MDLPSDTAGSRYTLRFFVLSVVVVAVVSYLTTVIVGA